MPVKKLTQASIHYRGVDQQTAALFEAVFAPSALLIREQWGLPQPALVKVIIMDSWPGFCLSAVHMTMLMPLLCLLSAWIFGAPFAWFFLGLFVLLALLLANVFHRVAVAWPRIGGLTLRGRKAPIIGIKPPRLLAKADKSIGERLFCPEADIQDKLKHLFCHELTHAFAAHLRLPPWLNEGLAMLSVDMFLGKATVRADTLLLFAQKTAPGEKPASAAKMLVDKEKALKSYARSYWLVRYLRENQPEFLREALAKRHDRRALDNMLAEALGLAAEGLWGRIDALLARNFQGEAPADKSPHPSS